MSNNWSFGYRVSPSQDRADRYVDATTNNPTINVNTEAEAEAARDEAFTYIDNNSITAPYQIVANGYYDDSNEGWVHAVVVTPESPEE